MAAVHAPRTDTKPSTSLTDAWRTMVPAGDDPHGPLPTSLLALTVVTGLVDAFSYLTLGHVFVANMTGNVVFLGFALAGTAGFAVAPSLVALGAFALGALAGGRLSTTLSAHRGRLFATACGVEACLLAASAGIAAVLGTSGSTPARYFVTVLLGLAMGTQNAVVRKLAVPDLTTTVLTRTITGIFADGRLAGGTNSKAGRRVLAALAMLLGGLAGALLVRRTAGALAVAAAAIILVVIAVSVAMQSRRDRPWMHPSNAD
jgi:uncharacterized membrane protein YoaK (UPF0700 family)